MKKVSKEAIENVASITPCPSCEGALYPHLKSYDCSTGVLIVSNQQLIGVRPQHIYFTCNRCGREVSLKHLSYQPMDPYPTEKNQP